MEESKDSFFNIPWLGQWISTRGASLWRELLLACSLALISHAKAQCLSPCFLNELLLWSNWRSLCCWQRGVGPLFPFSLSIFSSFLISPCHPHYAPLSVLLNVCINRCIKIYLCASCLQAVMCLQEKCFISVHRFKKSRTLLDDF